MTDRHDPESGAKPALGVAPPGGPKPPPEPKRPGPLEPSAFVKYLRPDAYVPSLAARQKAAVLEELLSVLEQCRSEHERASIHKLLLDRESVGSTALGKGLAVPHVRTAYVTSLTVVLGRSLEGIDFDAPDRKPVHVFFLVLGPNQDPGHVYLSFLATVVKAFKKRGMVSKVLKAASFEEIIGLLEDALTP